MTGPEWLDGAIRVESKRGGTQLGGPARFVWHTFEADPARLSARNGAGALVSDGHEVHFVLNPLTGDIVQLLPASRSAYGLANRAGGVETNRAGSVCLQVEVIAWASRPFTGILTAAGRHAVGKLVRFARAHGIPDVWPAGPPPAYPNGENVRSAATWLQHGGHYGHSQIPENDHGDPGALDTNTLFACAPIAPTPAPSRPTIQGVPVGYYLPTPPYRPGDGVLFVDGTGVYPVTRARWDVLRAEGVTSRVLTDAQWDALRAEVQPAAADLRAQVSDLRARLEELAAPPSTPTV